MKNVKDSAKISNNIVKMVDDIVSTYHDINEYDWAILDDYQIQTVSDYTPSEKVNMTVKKINDSTNIYFEIPEGMNLHDMKEIDFFAILLGVACVITDTKECSYSDISNINLIESSEVLRIAYLLYTKFDNVTKMIEEIMLNLDLSKFETLDDILIQEIGIPKILMNGVINIIKQ